MSNERKLIFLNKSFCFIKIFLVRSARRPKNLNFHGKHDVFDNKAKSIKKTAGCSRISLCIEEANFRKL